MCVCVCVCVCTFRAPLQDLAAARLPRRHRHQHAGHFRLVVNGRKQPQRLMLDVAQEGLLGGGAALHMRGWPPAPGPNSSGSQSVVLRPLYVKTLTGKTITLQDVHSDLDVYDLKCMVRYCYSYSLQL